MVIEKKSKVSIIIPVYNAEKYIEKCLKSVLNQTYTNIEIIIIDDGSSDKSYNILKEYKKNDIRIHLFSRENKGVSRTRIEGIEKSSGEYIMFLDADDWIEYNMIENMVGLIEKYNADICKCGIKFEKDIRKKESDFLNSVDKETYIEKNNFEEEIYKKFIVTYNFCSIFTQLIKKEKIKLDKIYFNLAYAEDFQFNMNLYSNIESIVFTPQNYYHYVENYNSVTRSYKFEKLRNNMEDSIFVHYLLYDYLKIWNIDNKDNRKLVANKILNEMSSHLLKLSRAEDVNVNKIKEQVKMICEKSIDKKIKNSIHKKDIEGNIVNKIIKTLIYMNKTRSILIIIMYIYRPYFKIKNRKVRK